MENNKFLLQGIQKPVFMQILHMAKKVSKMNLMYQIFYVILIWTNKCFSGGNVYKI